MIAAASQKTTAFFFCFTPIAKAWMLLLESNLDSLLYYWYRHQPSPRRRYTEVWSV